MADRPKMNTNVNAVPFANKTRGTFRGNPGRADWNGHGLSDAANSFTLEDTDAMGTAANWPTQGIGGESGPNGRATSGPRKKGE